MTIQKISDGALQPVNKDAVRSMMPGDHWEPADFKINQWWRVAPWLTHPHPNLPDRFRIKAVPVGTRFNRLVYLGIPTSAFNDNGHPLAAVRCDCGLYGQILAKVLIRSDAHGKAKKWQMCPRCRRHDEIRRMEALTPQERRVIYTARKELEKALGVKRTGNDRLWLDALRKDGNL